MSDDTKKLLELYESKRATRLSQQTAGRDPQLWSYRQAAAVLHCFVPDALQPVAPDLHHPTPQLLLFNDIVRAVGRLSEGLSMLKLDLRQQALRELSSREAMRKALAANPDRPRTDLQIMWEAYLNTGSVPAPEELSYRQLTDLSQLITWLDGMDPTLPPQSSILDLVRRKSVLASFEHLVIKNFTGRTAELQMLRAHIGAADPTTGAPAAGRQRLATLAQRKPILALYGPGGIGKSALVGQILWEQAQAKSHSPIPFAYLAFDHPTLRVETPFTLLVEAAAQFELQYPEHATTITQFNDQVRMFRTELDALGKRSKTVSSRGLRIDEVHKLDRELYEAFARLLATIGARPLAHKIVNTPVLLVFDTFEEVQYRDRESLLGFWRMLDIIHAAYPLFRVIISGRAKVNELEDEMHNVEVEELAELPMTDRVALLQRLGLADVAMAEAVAKQVGGNPLSLHLAANVVASDPTAATATGLKEWTFFQMDEQIIQGQLYQRILNQIHNEDVRKLAHPGMVLRRVNPEIILAVLAPVCELSIRRLGEAEALFEELRREYGLVQVGEDRTLIYRPEVRLAMIRLLEQDKYAKVRELHHAAIAFYAAKDGVTARAEEIYHRLVLDEDELWVLDQRWMPGIEQSIAAYLEEYPDRAKAWLASRMSLEVPRTVFEHASIAEWERNTTRKVQQLLSALEIERALTLLRERQGRSAASPLFALEAKAYLLRGDLPSAWTVLEQGVERVATSTNRGRLAELFWLQAQVALLRHEPALADQLLERAEHAVEKSSNPVPLMHILCHRLLLRDKYKAAYTETAMQLRLRLNYACERADEATLFSALFVIELTLSLLGNEFPKTAARLASLIQYPHAFSDDILTSENLQGLDAYREPWEKEFSPGLESAA